MRNAPDLRSGELILANRPSPISARTRGAAARTSRPRAGSRAGSDVAYAAGGYRWVVERTISWVLRFKRLGQRYDRAECSLARVGWLYVTPAAEGTAPGGAFLLDVRRDPVRAADSYSFTPASFRFAVSVQR